MSHDRIIGVGASSERFPESPRSVRNIPCPLTTDYEAIVEGSRMNLKVMLMAMVGGNHDLAEFVRATARRRFESGTMMEVAQIGDGAPFKTLYFQEGDELRMRRGSILEQDAGKSVHVRSTIMAKEDYVGRILTDPTVLTPETSFTPGTVLASDLEAKKNDILADTNFMMGDPGSRGIDVEATLYEYRRRIKDNVIDLRIGQNPIHLLREAVRDGNQYDLVFSDLAAVADRMAYLEAIQASLHPEGKAMIPITFWTGKPFGGIISERQIDDIVAIGDQEVPLEDYLASTHPRLFEVAKFGIIKVLVVKGSWLHQTLPLHTFEGEKRKYHNLTTGGLSIKWTPPQTDK